MWMCTCGKGKSLNHDHISYKKVKVDSDNVCQNCGYYAVWITDYYGSETEKEVTLVKKNTEDLKIMTTKEVAKFLGMMYVRLRFPASGAPYKPKNKDYVVFPRVLTELTEEDKKHVYDTIYYCFNKEGEIVYQTDSINKMTKLTGDKKEIIIANMRAQTFQTKNGYIYRDKKDFNVKKFLSSKRDFNQESLLDYSWKGDIMSYDNEELGVSYEPDYYGTWKEKLYS